MTLVSASQAQKEVTVNTALVTIDSLLNAGAIDRGLDTPPGSPADGDVYIIGSTPTGAWASNAGELAYYQAGWYFITPNEGLTIWVNDEDLLYSYDGTNWVTAAGITTLDGLSDVATTTSAQYDILQHNGTNFVNTATLDTLDGVGVNATPDSTNKLAVNSDAVLFNHNGTTSQVKVNKNAIGNTASHLFQTGFSGRAEFGLIANDDFEVKVSSDGSAWNQAYIVTASSGNIAFKQDVTFEGESNCGDNLLTRAKLKDYSEEQTTPSSSSGTLTLDLENGNVFEVTLTENVITTVFSNAPASGDSGSFTLILKQDVTGGRTFVWPASVDWAGGAAPTLTTTASAVDIMTFVTTDGGTRWYGFLAGSNMS